MALDGIFLHHVCSELKSTLLYGRIDKVYQPAKEDIVLAFGTRNGNKRLFISSRSDSGRLHLTTKKTDNPDTPPMLCMLFRKYLTNARLTDILQLGLDRLVRLSFDALNNVGDKIRLHLIVELMGKHSNIILLDDNDIIIDATKRIGVGSNSARIILPNVKYELPPTQDKLSMLQYDYKLIFSQVKDKMRTSSNTASAILSTVLGVSPIICRELEYRASDSDNLLSEQIEKLWLTVNNTSGEPYIIFDNDKKPLDIAFLEIKQYQGCAFCEKRESFNELLDDFFDLRRDTNRSKNLTKDLSHRVHTIKSKLIKKIDRQRTEIKESKKRDRLKTCGDILSANIFKLEKGMQSVELYDFYSDKDTIIKLDPRLTPSQNIQQYYKRYKKATNAEKILKQEIEKATQELEYLETVTEEIDRVTDTEQLIEIQRELFEEGYLKRLKTTTRKKKKFSPLTALTSSGNEVIIGRNNKENDLITLKLANKNDMWFHIKDFPGAHVILKAKEGNTLNDQDIYETACLAALNSKCKNSSNVAIDYTLVKNVKKPRGAKPGMVIYVEYKTIYANPEDAIKE